MKKERERERERERIDVRHAFNEEAKSKSNCKLSISHTSGVRLFDDDIGVRSTDATESAALLDEIEMVDIYSNSWGPGDRDWQVAGPGVLANQALKNGAKKVHFEYKFNILL